MKTKIPILILDDLEIHFKKIQQHITQILADKCEMEADFIYTYEENEKITKYESGNGYYHKSRYGASTNVRKSNLDKLNNLLKKIPDKNVIAVIDINWDSDDSANRHGRNFYDEHLKDKISPTNTIFVSLIEEKDLGKDLTLGFQFVPKKKMGEKGNVIDLDELFKQGMEAALCRTKLLSEGEDSEKESIVELVEPLELEGEKLDTNTTFQDY